MRSGDIRVVAIDDHPVMLLGIEKAARDAGAPVTLVESAGSVSELTTGPGSADVALLDLRLRDGSRPAENVAALQRNGIRVLVYTAGSVTPLITEALRAGARGVVLKHQPVNHLVDAITAVHAGDPFLPPELAPLVEESAAVRPRLTDREIEVLKLLFEGLVTKQVARRLGLAESTVKEHLKRIRSKYAALGRSARTRVELVQRAVEDGYLERRPM